VLAVVFLADRRGGRGGDSHGDPGAGVRPIVSATGEIVPMQWASLSLVGGGVVADLPCEGDVVVKGELLLQLSGREQLEAALAAAKLEQVGAQQALDQVHKEEELARAQAQSDLANARDEVRKAEYDRSVQQEGNRASDDTVKKAKANVTVAEDVVDEARTRYNKTPGKSDSARKAGALARIVGQGGTRLARRALNWYVGHPTEIQQAMLDACCRRQARLGVAELAWQDVQDGPDPDVLAAEARSPRRNRGHGRQRRCDSALHAPFGGTVAAVHQAQRVGALGCLDRPGGSPHLQETTDLSEIDVARSASVRR
jgi:multidrug efflux pump subunit AcrA (membrane-fusion protein)